MTSAKTRNQVSFSVAINPLHHDRPYQEFFEKFVPMQCQECINPNCSQKKQSAIKHIWHAHTLIYKPNEDHMASTIAPTLNIITMLVNGEQFLFWKTNVVKNNYTSPWARVVCIT